MAILREPEYCTICGEQLEEMHRDQSGIPLMMQNIGDNFIGYKPHNCKSKPSHTPTEAAEDGWIRMRDCYNKYIHFLAEQLFEFRKLAKDIHGWATEKSLEKKMRALDRLETEFYQLSIAPESAEIIDARKSLADALKAMELYHRTSPSTGEGTDCPNCKELRDSIIVLQQGFVEQRLKLFTREQMRDCFNAGMDAFEDTNLPDTLFNDFINTLKQ